MKPVNILDFVTRTVFPDSSWVSCIFMTLVVGSNLNPDDFTRNGISYPKSPLYREEEPLKVITKHNFLILASIMKQDFAASYSLA